GALVGTTGCNGHADFGRPTFCSLVFDEVIATTGDHQLAVSDGGADNTGNYVLQIERIPPVPPLPVLPYNLAVDDRIDPPTDRDCMAWEATANTQVQVTLRSLTPGLDPEIQVLDPTGATVTKPSCSGHSNGGILCTIQANLTPALTGTYAFCIRDNGANNVGNYEIDLQCLSGTCPNPNHPPQLAPIAARTGAIGQPVQIPVSA